MRFFNPETMTEVLPGIHDMTNAIELPDSNWFFSMTEIPEGKCISTDDAGNPILIEVLINSK